MVRLVRRLVGLYGLQWCLRLLGVPQFGGMIIIGRVLQRMLFWLIARRRVGRLRPVTASVRCIKLSRVMARRNQIRFLRLIQMSLIRLLVIVLVSDLVLGWLYG